MEFGSAQVDQELDEDDPQSPEPRKQNNNADEMNTLQEPDENQRLELLSPEHRNLNFNSEYKDKDNSQMRSI